MSLHDLTDLLEELEAAHANQVAIRILDRVLLLSHNEIHEFAPLAECQARSRALLAAIGRVPLPERHPDVTLLADGRHVFAQLLELVEKGHVLDDERWQSLEASVGDAYGRVLAVAAARGKLQVAGSEGVDLPVAELVVAAARYQLELSAADLNSAPIESEASVAPGVTEGVDTVADAPHGCGVAASEIRR